MENSSHKNFTGVLYKFLKEDQKIPTIWNNFHFIENIHEEASNWHNITIRSEKPLIREDMGSTNPHFFYKFLLRSSSNGKRFLLLSTHEELVGIFLELVKWRNYVQPANIKVYNLVKELTEKPDRYCLGIVYARVDGYCRSLRTISLYGADLAEAQLFRDILPKLVPFRTQLREVRTGSEILQVSFKGEVSFSYNNTNSLIEVDQALHFLTTHGFLIWEQG